MQISWSDVWDVFRDIILPESLTVIWSLVLYGILGVLVTVLLLVLGHRQRIFKRIPKYYNWAVKLYIPLVIIGTLYFALQWGLGRGVYKVIDHQTPTLTDGLYHAIVDPQFKSPEEKEEFLKEVKVLLVTYQHSSREFAEQLKAMILENNSNVGLIDDAKNKLSTWLIDEYKDEIFSAVVFGAQSMAGEKAGVNGDLSWQEASKALDILLQSDANHIETAIQQRLGETGQHLLASQYKKFWYSTVAMWVLIVLLGPILEFLIYKKWLEPRFKAKLEAKENEGSAFAGDQTGVMR
ncbi:MAG: hypothetical protein U0176_00610 [Bacteroidia bacterium]